MRAPTAEWLRALRRAALLGWLTTLLAAAGLSASPDPEPAPPSAPDAEPTAEAGEALGPWWDTDGARLNLHLDPFLPAEYRTDPKAKKEGRLRFLVVPNLRFNPDDGLGVGLNIPLVQTDPDLKPYRFLVRVRFSATTQLVQRHELQVDYLHFLGLPLRLTGRAGLYAIMDEPYCGGGTQRDCDGVDSGRAADGKGLTGEEREAFEERYDTMRIVRPWGWGIARLSLAPLADVLAPAQVFAGWRSDYYVPGFFGNWLEGRAFEPGPYPESRFAKDHPDGQPGLANVAQAGVIFDSRDHEPTPTEGVFVEASVRGSSRLILSAWEFFGVNVTARTYAPLDSRRQFILASRLVVDRLWGDVPVQQQVRFGGTASYRGIGGRILGRGIRRQRFFGNAKAGSQHELRWRAFGLDGASRSYEIELLGFVDTGAVLGSKTILPGPDFRFAYSFGPGLRMVFNERIVLRFDLGFSPEEGFRPFFYVDTGHAF